MAYPDNYSTAVHRSYEGQLTAYGESLKESIDDLKACRDFMLAAIRNAVDLAKHQGRYNACFDDFEAHAKDWFGDEIGSLENKLSNPFDEEIWGGG
jgi:hypothetical protein